MTELRVYYDKEKSAEVEKKLFEKWDETQRKGISRVVEKEMVHKSTEHGTEYHVYDVIYCPMKKICRALGFEKKVTKKSIGLMLFGIVAQMLVQWLYPPEQREYQAMVYEIIQGHIDIFEDFEYPLEIKASRKRIFKRDQLPEKWVKQTMAYMAITGKKKGWILILNVFTCQVSAWCIEMTSKEILGQLVVMMHNATEIAKAIPTKDFDSLDVHPSEYQYCNYKHSCPKRKLCREKAKRMGYLEPYKKKAKKKSPLD
jgi:hypothetical protein